MENFPKNQQEYSKKFNQFFSEGSISKIKLSDLPEDTLKRFESDSSRFILPKDYKSGNFEDVYIIKHTNGDVSYIAEQEKIYDKISNEKEKNIYFYEKRGENKIGHGEVRINTTENSPIYLQPFVGFTSTEEEYKRQGLGDRRIHEMSAYVKMKYDLPLYSDSTITDEALALWKKLIEAGKAEIIEINGIERYRTKL